MANRASPVSPEERRQRSDAAKAARALLEARRRWYIAMSCKDSWDPDLPDRYGRRGYGGYRKFVWPLLFRSEVEAWDFACVVNVFRNVDAIPGRGRIKSYTIESTLLPETT